MLAAILKQESSSSSPLSQSDAKEKSDLSFSQLLKGISEEEESGDTSKSVGS